MRVETAKVERNGGTAVVPEGVVTFDGHPSDDDDTPNPAGRRVVGHRRQLSES